MKKLIIITLLLSGLINLKGQILISADSVINCRSDERKENFTVVSREAEKFSLEIDKDLMTLRIYGTGHEHALIERAFIVDLLSVDDDNSKWVFQAEDKNCIAYTITLDTDKKTISFLTFGKDTDNRSMTMFYYPIAGIKINTSAIEAHLKEKGNIKF